MNSQSPVDLSAYQRENYDPGSWLRRAAWYLANLLFMDTPIPWPGPWKAWLLRRFGTRIGAGAVLKPRLRIKFPWNLSVGDHRWLEEDGIYQGNPAVRIGTRAIGTSNS